MNTCIAARMHICLYVSIMCASVYLPARPSVCLSASTYASMCVLYSVLYRSVLHCIVHVVRCTGMFMCMYMPSAHLRADAASAFGVWFCLGFSIPAARSGPASCYMLRVHTEFRGCIR